MEKQYNRKYDFSMMVLQKNQTSLKSHGDVTTQNKKKALAECFCQGFFSTNKLE